MDEKHLLKMMDRAYKMGGYLLIVGNRGIELVCDGAWRFGLNHDKVSAKIKAKLVEHMDFLPEGGQAWFVRPDGAQSADMAVALSMAAAWVPQRRLPVQLTAVEYQGMVIYQNEGTKVCAAIPTTWLLTAGMEDLQVDTAAGLVFCESEGVSASGVCATKRQAANTESALRLNAVLRALEKVRLVGATAAEEMAQQESMWNKERSGEDAEESAEN